MTPVLNPIAQRLYDELEPFAYADEENGFILAYWLEAWTQSLVELDSLVRYDETHDRDSYGKLLDITLTPDNALDFLSQFVGAVLSAGLSADDKRALLAGGAGLHRGSPASLIAAIAVALTGTKTVRLHERTEHHAYRFNIVTSPSETPDVAKADEAIRSQKPGGLVYGFQQNDKPMLFEYTRSLSGVVVTLHDATLADVT
jgi:hypothetical protein